MCVFNPCLVTEIDQGVGCWEACLGEGLATWLSDPRMTRLCPSAFWGKQKQALTWGQFTLPAAREAEDSVGGPSRTLDSTPPLPRPPLPSPEPAVSSAVTHVRRQVTVRWPCPGRLPLVLSTCLTRPVRAQYPGIWSLVCSIPGTRETCSPGGQV